MKMVLCHPSLVVYLFPLVTLFILVSSNESTGANELDKKRLPLETSTSGVPGWIAIRNSSLRVENRNVCRAHFSAKRDLCDKSLIPEPEVPIKNADFLLANCYCDESCATFGDCCIDKVTSLMSNPSAFGLSNITSLLEVKQPYSCVDLPISTNGLYAYKKCDPAFANTEINHLCVSQPRSFLQWFPAYSVVTKIFYRNLFCAVCNHDYHSLHQWNMQLACDHDNSSINVFPFIKESNFNYTTGKWEFRPPEASEKWSCDPVLIELEEYESRTKFGTRACQPVIDSCPPTWEDSTIANACESYTFYVGLRRTRKIYKNSYCARCNIDSVSDLRALDCDIGSLRPPNRSPGKPNFISLRQLFDFDDFSFPCSLSHGEVYDPKSKSCLVVQCDANYTVNPDTGRCESRSIDLSGRITLKSGCLRIFVNASDYILLPNRTIVLKEAAISLPSEAYQKYIKFDPETQSTMTGILACYDEYMSHRYSAPMYSDYIQGFLSIITSSISIFGLTGYLLVTLSVPRLRNFRARMFMSLSFALLVANVSLICGYLARPARSHSDGGDILLNSRGSLFCAITSINLHYWYLASFAWMNVIAYDATKSFKRTHERLNNSQTRFLQYSLYSWLLPAFIVLISVCFDISNISADYRPMYGHRICWISQRQPLLVFFVIPAAILILANFVFYVLTSWFLYKAKRSSLVVIRSRSNAETYANHSLFCRLAVLMGLTWTFWFFAAFPSIDFLWYIFITLNGLQGAFIFFSFTFRKEVGKAIRDRIYYLSHGHDPVSSNLSSSKNTTTSLPLLIQTSNPKSQS